MMRTGWKSGENLKILLNLGGKDRKTWYTLSKAY